MMTGPPEGGLFFFSFMTFQGTLAGDGGLNCSPTLS
jgi:hypothetical protein